MKEYQYHKDDRSAAVRRRRDLVRKAEMMQNAYGEEESKKVQARLEINQPGDKHEQEADEVARKVVSGEGVNGVNSNSSGVQKKHDEEEKGTLMARGESGGLNGTAELQGRLDASKGGGQSLDDKTKGDMESKMGADLSDVKIHTGTNAHEMAEGINAKAFTHGQDIYFKDGNYDASSKEGKELLAHELTHTQQQKDGVERKVQRKTPEKQNNNMPALVTYSDATPITVTDAFVEPSVKQQTSNFDLELGNLVISDINTNSAKPAVVDKDQQRLEKLNGELDAPATMYAAIDSLNKEGAGGWNILLNAAFNKSAGVQATIKSKFSEWLKKPGSPFSNYLILVAGDMTTVLSDYAIAVLDSNKLGSFVDNKSYIASIGAKMAVAADMFRQLLPTGDKNLNYAGLISDFEVKVTEAKDKLKVYPQDRITTLGADVSDVLTYLKMAQEMKDYLSQFYKVSGGDITLITHDNKAPAISPNPNNTSSADENKPEPGPYLKETTDELVGIYLNASDLKYGLDRYTFTSDGLNYEYRFETTKKDLKDQYQNLRKNINDSMVNELVGRSSSIVTQIENLTSYLGTDLYGGDKILAKLETYRIKYGALALMGDTLKGVAATNPNAFYAFWGERMREMPDVQSDLYCAGVAANIYQAWKAYDSSWMAFLLKVNAAVNPLDIPASLANQSLEQQKSLLSLYFIKCGVDMTGNFTASFKAQSISDMLKEQRYIDMMAIAKEFGELESTFKKVVMIVVAVAIVVASIVTAGAAAELGVLALGGEISAITGEVSIGGSAILGWMTSFAIEVVTFTAVSRTLNAAIGQKSETSFGEDLFWNAVTFGALKGVGQVAGEIEKGASSLEKIMFKGGVAVAEIDTMTLIDALHHTYQQSQLPSDKRQEFDTLSHLVQGAGMLIGIKIGMSMLAKLPPGNILENSDPSLKPELDAKELEFEAQKKILAEREFTPEEQQQFKDLTKSILEIRMKMVDSAIEKTPNPLSKKGRTQIMRLKGLKTDLKQKTSEIENGNTAVIKTSPIDPNLLVFEGSVAEAEAFMKGKYKGGIFSQSGLDSNAYTYTTADGKQFRLVRSGSTEQKNLDLNQMAKDQSFNAGKAREEFWREAGDENIGGDPVTKDNIVEEAIIDGWRPGNKNFPEIPLEKGRRFVRTEGHGEIQEKFGENVKQVKAVDALEKLPHPQLKELLSQVNGFEQMNRLSDLVPDIGKVKNVKFETNYIVVDGKTIIDDARLITNDDLAVKVRDNPGQFKDINNSLSQVTDADKLQADLLNDTVRNFFVELNQSGKSNVSANEQIERAKLGEKNHYKDVQQIIDFYEAGDIYKTLSEGSYQDFLDTTTGKKNQKLKYEQEQKDRDKANADREKHPTESKKKLEELKTRLDLDISLENLSKHMEGTSKKGNPFEDSVANQLLMDAAENYVKNGGKDKAEFTGKLIDEGGLSKRQSKNESVKNSIDKSFEEANKTPEQKKAEAEQKEKDKITFIDNIKNQMPNSTNLETLDYDTLKTLQNLDPNTYTILDGTTPEQLKTFARERVLTKPTKNIEPLSPEHKADRWERHIKERGADAESYDTWSNKYDVNMGKAKKAQAGVEEYQKQLGWGTTKQTNVEVMLDGVKTVRKPDITDVKGRRGVEVKEYEGGIVRMTEDVTKEAKLDKVMVEEMNWQMEWVFINCSPSAELRAFLETFLKPEQIKIITK
jgi:hypothetical protein